MLSKEVEKALEKGGWKNNQVDRNGDIIVESEKGRQVDGIF